MMKVFFPTLHSLHHPRKDYSDGLPPFNHLEIPQRIDRLLDGLQASGITETVGVETEALEAVRQLHDPDYIDFLLSISGKIKSNHEYIPTVFRNDLSAAALEFRGGMYCTEIGSPLGPGTVKAALNSGATALAAADHLITSNEDVFGVCRPPGHHAGRRRYGGYCYFNNAYLAAQGLNASGRQCAVLDVDYHLGDGSLEFANERAPYFSLHADPWRNYPYLSNDTRYESPYVHCSVFPSGINGDGYLLLLEELTRMVARTHPQTAIVSLGFDTLGTDYIQDEQIYLTPKDYALLGGVLAKLTCPILFLLEGGYDIEKLSECGRQFIRGFLSARDMERGC